MAFCAVGFGSDFTAPMNNFWLIMIISTIAAVVAVQLIHVPFFQRAGAESAREAWLEHQRQEAQRGRGLSIPVDQPPKPAESGCSCEGCYGHCCGKRYPEGCKVVCARHLSVLLPIACGADRQLLTSWGTRDLSVCVYTVIGWIHCMCSDWIARCVHHPELGTSLPHRFHGRHRMMMYCCCRRVVH